MHMDLISSILVASILTRFPQEHFCFDQVSHLGWIYRLGLEDFSTLRHGKDPAERGWMPK